MIAPDLPAPRQLLRDDALMRLQRRIGLAPEGGLGTRRRAVALGLLAWLPIAVWGVATGHGFAPTGESLLQHYAVTVKLLVAVPLMIAAEAVALRDVLRIAPHCAAAGLFRGDPAALRRIALDLVRLRDAAHPWVVGTGVALGWIGAWQHAAALTAADEMLAWAGPDGASAFGAAWYLWVGRPIFVACCLVWLWRAVLLAIALNRLAGAGFVPVPTHPDRAGGFGFLETLVLPFGLVAFAISSVVGAVWAHEVAVHDAVVTSYAVPMAMMVAIPTMLFVAPLLVLTGPLFRARRRALLEYGALVARHGDALRQRWILRRQVDDPVLDAPEIGAAADAAALYESVARMRPVLVRVTSVLYVAVPAALPMLGVLAMQVPLVPMMGRLLAALL